MDGRLRLGSMDRSNDISSAGRVYSVRMLEGGGYYVRMLEEGRYSVRMLERGGYSVRML